MTSDKWRVASGEWALSAISGVCVHHAANKIDFIELLPPSIHSSLVIRH